VEIIFQVKWTISITALQSGFEGFRSGNLLFIISVCQILNAVIVLEN